MGAYVLLKILNKVVKRLASDFITFCNEFNKFNNTEARILI